MDTRKITSAASAVLMAIMTPVSPAASQIKPSMLADGLDAAVDAAIAQGRVVGLVLLVAENGRVVYARAAGYADREALEPMREDHLFRLASITKPIVSAAALALMEQGRLGRDDDIAQWLPGFRPLGPDGAPAKITVRQLLTHTAGFTYGFLEPSGHAYHRSGVSDGLDLADLTLDKNVGRIASVPLTFAPGSAWRYSVATDVLGAVIARAAGTTLPEAVRTLVTDPLGLTDTDFVAVEPHRLTTAYAPDTPTPVRMADGHAVPFSDGTLLLAPGRALRQDAFPSGGAGMVGTARDVLRFLEVLRTGGAPILRASTVREMTRDQIRNLEGPMPGWGFGFGFAVLRDTHAAASPQSEGTYGWGGVYGHSWFVDPVRGITAVLLTNTALEGMTGPLPAAVRDAVYAASS